MTRSDGSIVIAGLDSTVLAKLASEGDGAYREITTDDDDIDSLLAAMTANPDATENTGLQTDTWREEGPWLLLPLLPLAALVFRRGVLAVWLLALLIPVHPARAFEAADLWARPDQQASQLLDEGDAASAAALFKDPAWKAAAAYRAGQYAESVAALEGLDDIESVYNRGNALARLQRYDEAIAAYEDVLRREPDHSDASHNLELLKKLQQEQQQQQSDGKDGRQGTDSQSEGEGNSQGQDDSAKNQNGANDAADAADSSSVKSSEQSGASDSQPESMQKPGRSQSTDQASNADSSNAAQTGTPQPGEQESPADTDAPAGPMNGSEGIAQEDAAAVASSDARPADEEAQALEQWLRKIPDDPGGLLRRKFYYQYQQQGDQEQEEQPW